MVLTYRDASGAPGKATAEYDIVEARFADRVSRGRAVGPGVRPGHLTRTDDPNARRTLAILTWLT